MITKKYQVLFATILASVVNPSFAMNPNEKTDVTPITTKDGYTALRYNRKPVTIQPRIETSSWDVCERCEECKKKQNDRDYKARKPARSGAAK